MPRPKRDVVRLEVRLPPELHAALTAAAAAQERSINAEIVVRLRQAVESPPKPRGPVK